RRSRQDQGSSLRPLRPCGSSPAEQRGTMHTEGHDAVHLSFRVYAGVMRSSQLFGSIRSHEQLKQALDRLIDDWCEARQLDALRRLLPVWPLHSPLTDGFGDLMVALQTIEHSVQLKADHRETVHAAAQFVTGLVHHRLGSP